MEPPSISEQMRQDKEYYKEMMHQHRLDLLTNYNDNMNLTREKSLEQMLPDKKRNVVILPTRVQYDTLRHDESVRLVEIQDL